MKNKDKIKQDFNLNIDSQKEFEKINGKMELVDDSICLMGKFSKLKKSMILTCSVLGALLVGSIGWCIIDNAYEEKLEQQKIQLFSDSLLHANEYFEINGIIDNTCLLTYFIDNETIINIYDVNRSFIGQLFSSVEMVGYTMKYSFDNVNKLIVLYDTNTIWEFGDIKDKDIDITLYKNNLIVDTFSFKI